MKKQIHLNENELNSIIKESVKRVLKQMNESVSKTRQVAEISVNPYDYCDTDEECECLEQNNIKDDYRLFFQRVLVVEPMVMYYPDGSGYPGSEEGENFEMTDDNGLFNDIEPIKETCPELYNTIYDEIDGIQEYDLNWEDVDW